MSLPGSPEWRTFQANGPALTKAKVGSYEDFGTAGGQGEVKNGNSAMSVQDQPHCMNCWRRGEADGT